MKYLFLAALALLRSLAAEPYTVTIGSLPVRMGETVRGSVYYTFYRKEGALRPITFCFNGGPGSSSVWLHIMALGPKRVLSPEEGQSITPPYTLIDNPDSILDLTDLVFVDPIGTGFSRPSNPAEEESFYSMEGDIESLGDFIRDFITREGRWNSPKYLVGESYGGLRVCGLSGYLQSHHHLFLNGIILISPVIDLRAYRFDSRDNELAFIHHLPTFAATAWFHGHLPHLSLTETVSAAREFALSTFAPELFRRGFVPEHLYGEIAAWTGLPLSLVEEEQGLISEGTFFAHFGAPQRVSRFDGRLLGERLPGSSRFEFFDLAFSQVLGIGTAAFHDYLYSHLDSKQEWPRYEIISREVNRQWSYDALGYPSQLEAVRKTLLANPSMKIFAACGYFDLAMPFAAVEYSLKRLHLPCENNVSFGYYEGGHMFYTNPTALKQFKTDLQAFYTR